MRVWLQALTARACPPLWVLVGALGVLVAFAIGMALSLYQAGLARTLMDQANALTPDDKRVAAQQAILQFQADNLAKIWTTIVQGLGAVVLTVGGYFTWRNLRVTQQTLKATQEKLEVDREGQITNRFTQAIGQLGAQLQDGKPNLEVRLGAIYALERIARDSPRDHWTIMEVLTAYVRQNAPVSPLKSLPTLPGGRAMTPTDIQAVLTVLGRRSPTDQRRALPLEEQRKEPTRLMLRYADLRGLGLRKYGQEDPTPNLRRASLRHADLSGAHLQGSDLQEADLVGAVLRDADLSGARLERAHLTEGKPDTDANLERANLMGMHLEDARVTQEQVYSALNHGEGAFLPLNWPAAWRESLQQ